MSFTKSLGPVVVSALVGAAAAIGTMKLVEASTQADRDEWDEGVALPGVLEPPPMTTSSPSASLQPGLAVTREEAMRELHAEFDRQAARHRAEPVNSEWRGRMEGLVVQRGESRADELGIEFLEVSCRSTSCLLEFTAPNDTLRERSQGPLAATDFGAECATLVVAFPADDPDAVQTMRMILDCSES